MMKVIYEATKKTADGQELPQENYLKTFLLVYFVRFPCKGKYLAKCKQITLNPKPDSNTIPCNQWSNHVQKIANIRCIKIIKPH